MFNRSRSVVRAVNGLQIAEGGELEVQILNIAQMIIRSTTLDFSTASPLLAMCCYVSVFFFIFCAWAIKSLNHLWHE